MHSPIPMIGNTGTNGTRKPRSMPIGVPVVSLTLDSQRGISPSRDIANVIRVWP
jgi:hypothetical protein